MKIRALARPDGAAKRNRFLKNSVYARLPLYLRAVLMYVYRYVFRLGFLDGRVGLVFHFMHGLWLFMLIDAKLDEAREFIKTERRRGVQTEPSRSPRNRFVMAGSPSSPQRRPVVLVLLGCFWPGNDSSGPNQSFKALASALGDQFEFRLVARDRPTGPAQAAPLRNDGWIDLGFAHARYCSIGALGATGLRSLIHETPHDVLWLNSIFDREFSLPALAMRRLGWIKAKPTLLSPRGEFGVGALSLKSSKKRALSRGGASAALVARRHLARHKRSGSAGHGGGVAGRIADRGGAEHSTSHRRRFLCRLLRWRLAADFRRPHRAGEAIGLCVECPEPACGRG